MTRRRSHQAAQHHGQRAETLCALLLRLKFYTILARQWRGVGGELDIVAKRGNVVAIIEVKARDAFASAADALSRTQRRRIGAAARQFMSAHPEFSACDLRYDLMLVIPGRLPRHLTGAWLEGD